VTDQTLSTLRPAARPLADPPRELTFATFLALALIPFCWALLLRQRGVNGVLVVWLFGLPYFAWVLLAAQADQNLARAQRTGLDKLAVVLLLAIYPLNAVPYWFAARHLARYPAARLALWVIALSVAVLALIYVVDWPTLLPPG